MGESKINFWHEMFRYEDGKLFWRERPLKHFSCERFQKSFNSRYANKEVGMVDPVTGYRNVAIGGKRNTGIHRIIFYLHHGYLPTLIDHKDGNRTNNRIENLRPTDWSGNSINRCLDSRNSTGVKGVSYDSKRKRFLATIQVNQKTKHLGCFIDIFPAVCVRKAAEIEFYGEFRSDR